MLNRFQLADHGSTPRREVIAGMTTFLASVYIVAVNPAILSPTGMPFAAVLTATVLVSAFSSLAMGLYANNPIILAPGMGLNVFFAVSVVEGMGVRWETALGAVFWSGIVFLIMSIYGIRERILRAIPMPLRYATSAGIGLFITLIGLTNAGFITADGGLRFGGFTPVTLTFVAGLLLTAILVARRVRGALAIGITLTTLLAVPAGRWWEGARLVEWQGLVQAPDFSLVFQLDLWGSLHLAVWPVMFAFLFTDLFDSTSTLIGVSEAAGLVDESGEPRRIGPSLVVDGLATTLSGLLGSSPGTCYIESATGVEAGGRTGLTAVVAGLLFLPFMFVSPLLSMIPAVATAPALVLVGVFMMTPVTRIAWHRFDEAIPAFLALVLIPGTHSITQGIVWGFLGWTVIKVGTGRWRELTPTLVVIDVFAVLALYLGG